MINGKVIDVEYPLETAREAFWLAYKSAGAASGMGMLQARDNVNRENVFENVKNEGDYPGEPIRSGDGELYGDYVFGRMLKLRLEIKGEGVEVPTTEVDPRYQGWARKYESYEELIQAAVENVAEMDESEIEMQDKGYWQRFKDLVT